MCSSDLRTFSGEDVAGPSVHTILARRFMGLLVGSSVTPTGCTRHGKKNGVDDGARTRDPRDHNPMLCQLSYIHRQLCSGCPAVRHMARLEGIEPPTDGLEIRCSIRLSYRRKAPPPARWPARRKDPPRLTGDIHTPRERDHG